MIKLTQQTKPVKINQIERHWYLVNADKQILGRVSTKIADLLVGKQKAIFTRHLDCGDYVVVINALKIKVTGNKADQKTYSRYSGYPGGLKIISYKQMKQNRPTEIVRRAVYNMLPKNKLQKRMITRLFIYPDDKHPYQNKFKSQKEEVKS